MKKIVAIGGTDISKKSTALIDEEIIKLSGKSRPNFLFIPTASSDDEGYWHLMQTYFGGYWGCVTDVLFLIKERPSKQEIKKKIDWADIIYVGGGNTLMMMRLWRRIGVDLMLKAAWNKGTVLCGVSAGSICWFEFGHSDSMSFYNSKNWEYIRVRGLGFIQGINCPHYDSATLGVLRRLNFQAMVKKIGGLGFAIDDNCALVFMDNEVKVFPAQAGAGAYRVFKQAGNVVEERI